MGGGRAMRILEAVCYVLVAAGGTAVVLTRDPRRQAMMQSLFGMVLTLLFLVLQAPDVALAEAAVGAVAVPLMILVVLANIRADDRRSEDGGHSREGEVA